MIFRNIIKLRSTIRKGRKSKCLNPTNVIKLLELEDKAAETL